MFLFRSTIFEHTKIRFDFLYKKRQKIELKQKKKIENNKVFNDLSQLVNRVQREKKFSHGLTYRFTTQQNSMHECHS